jgi:hypothetical protein
MVKPKRDAQFGIRFSREEKAALERLALQQDVTATQLVRRAIKQILCPHRGERRK